MSDPASTNGGEADETDLEAAPEVVADEADQTHAIVDEDEAILEAALDRKFLYESNALTYLVNQIAPMSAQRKIRTFSKLIL